MIKRAALALILLLAGCDIYYKDGQVVQEGDKVKHCLDGREGIIITVYGNGNGGTAIVRFPLEQAVTEVTTYKTQRLETTHFYVDVQCRPWEITKTGHIKP